MVKNTDHFVGLAFEGLIFVRLLLQINSCHLIPHGFDIFLELVVLTANLKLYNTIYKTSWKNSEINPLAILRLERSSQMIVSKILSNWNKFRWIKSLLFSWKQQKTEGLRMYSWGKELSFYPNTKRIIEFNEIENLNWRNYIGSLKIPLKAYREITFVW